MKDLKGMKDRWDNGFGHWNSGFGFLVLGFEFWGSWFYKGAVVRVQRAAWLMGHGFEGWI